MQTMSPPSSNQAPTNAKLLPLTGSNSERPVVDHLEATAVTCKFEGMTEKANPPMNGVQSLNSSAACFLRHDFKVNTRPTWLTRV